MIRLDISERTFHFRQPAGTSRGVYTTRHSWFVTATDDLKPGKKGIGECAPLPNLSCDDIDNYECLLAEACRTVMSAGHLDHTLLRPYPSMLFGIETALMSLNTGSHIIYDTPFSRGEEGIRINGLVWMGSYEEMLARMEEKLEKGFRCVKIKIGAIDFDREVDLIAKIRKRFSAEIIELRLDANGAFSLENALPRLQQLARYDIHSIEQPIRQHQWKEMAYLCKVSPIPIALDEELIGVNLPDMKEYLLDTIRPAYIILKPSLHGGLCGSEEWIRMARNRGIGSWVTSALESNVGLCAIAQFAAYMYGCPPAMPQGLGTGLLFDDNIEMPLSIVGDQLFLRKELDHAVG